MKFFTVTFLLVGMLHTALQVSGQQAYFIDGYHGGVYGHYPKGFTQFIVDGLKKHPDWRLNLEIEPETWDSVAKSEPAALRELQRLFADQSSTGRIEYVSPAYGQSYLYNGSGESMIRHFAYGMKKVRTYFPRAVFTTYSSEEPCFTSALPQILRSFGFRYASLKNPNTCWGGYTRAYGGELVNWVGPDGTRLPTVPRYASEGLLPNSTWQTEAWVNSPEYIKNALAAGIKNPVGMTLQDAGWKNGPWIGNGDRGYQPTRYVTWRNYFELHATKKATEDWRFSQEDLRVSLVWGSQVLQRIAQQVRRAENKVVMAEKLAAMARFWEGAGWPSADLDEAWRTLMLAQHHDCWIVPYNGTRGDTWADRVARWTDNTIRTSDRITYRVAGDAGPGSGKSLRVYNTSGSPRKEVVGVLLPEGLKAGEITVVEEGGSEVLTQQPAGARKDAVYFMASVPALGYGTYRIEERKPRTVAGARAITLENGDVVLETDRYRLTLDGSKGGAIKSLVAKKLDGKEFVDGQSERGFNALRGYFYNRGGYRSTTEHPVRITIVENGPALVSAQIRGFLFEHPYTQTITLKQGDRKIACGLKIDWQANIGIGDAYRQGGGLDAKDYRKPFYDDSRKLLAQFPVAFPSGKIYKDAPFDVTESRLENTFFRTWDSIKNNVVLNWVDVYDAEQNFGLALITDHTTTYTHGAGEPFGLNIQYSGAGLWGRNHTITGPTEINYALVPHKGKWAEDGLQQESLHWNEPLVAVPVAGGGIPQRSLLDVGTGYVVTTVQAEGNDLLVRLFNAEGKEAVRQIAFRGSATEAVLEELNGAPGQKLVLKRKGRASEFRIGMPRFGIRTVRLKNFSASR